MARARTEDLRPLTWLTVPRLITRWVNPTSIPKILPSKEIAGASSSFLLRIKVKYLPVGALLIVTVLIVSTISRYTAALT